VFFLFAVPGLGIGGAPIALPVFSVGGVPIAVLGGVFAGGLPLAGPVSELFRGGAGPLPPTLFASTISPGGPIEAFLLGSSGTPIGAGSLGGIGAGAAAIGAPAPAGGSPILGCL
jgi:hypothetical protein